MRVTIGYLFVFVMASFNIGMLAEEIQPPEACKVLRVYRTGGTNRLSFAHRGQVITVDVINLKKFLDCEAVTNDLPKLRTTEERMERLVLVMNGISMIGCVKIRYPTPTDDESGIDFKLNRDANDQSSKKSWNELFSSVSLFEKTPVEVTIGFENGGWLMGTDVTKKVPDNKFEFEAVPTEDWFVRGAFVFVLLALVCFLYLAVKYDIIRDPYVPKRPDDNAAFNLARSQMAFWFFLVLASYLLLWAMTDEKNTITDSVLILMGISTGTALGSALVDAGKGNEGGRNQYLVEKTKPDGVKKTSDEIIKEIEANKVAHETNLIQTLKTIDTTDSDADRTKARGKQLVLEQAIHRCDVQLAFYRSGRFWRFVVDILGDEGAISFHRFQIAAWTVVLGIIFVKEVVTNLAMPDFSSTLLALMGISGGTYVGFKIPAAKT